MEFVGGVLAWAFQFVVSSITARDKAGNALNAEKLARAIVATLLVGGTQTFGLTVESTGLVELLFSGSMAALLGTGLKVTSPVIAAALNATKSIVNKVADD